MSKRYKVELTVLAREQIFQIAQYIKIKLQAPDAATKLVDLLESEISKLDIMPERISLLDTEPWRSKGVHKYVVGHYIIYFLINKPDQIVQIIAVVLDRREQQMQLEQIDI